ncbi:MAG: hypothetical protein GXX99_02700 [Clostridiales bacterium]|nr:hypothetical protein [Clostridiales bacterium]
MEQPCVNVLWMYPDSLHLHGDRGNLMALQRVGALLGISVRIRRLERPGQTLPLDWADLLLFCSGELRVMPALLTGLRPQRAELAGFAAQRGRVLAIGSAGTLLARETRRLPPHASFEGLGLLDMVCTERGSVYGDDLWFRLLEEDPLELYGSQIQIVDTALGPGQAPLGEVLYGRGNDGAGAEGARREGLIFTNALGPLLVKNPRFAQRLLARVLADKGTPPMQVPADAAHGMEDAAFALFKRFTVGKEAEMARDGVKKPV